jgi:hypothetical protein
MRTKYCADQGTPSPDFLVSYFIAIEGIKPDTLTLFKDTQASISLNDRAASPHTIEPNANLAIR